MRVKGMPDCVRFRLYPEEGSRLYVDVRVWRTLGLLRAYGRRDGARVGNRLVGYCSSRTVRSYRKGRYVRTKGVVAEVHVCRPRLGCEVVTHEMAHAAFAWVHRRGLVREVFLAEGSRGLVSEVEERVVGVIGRLSGLFVARALKLGVYQSSDLCQAG